ncbi:MAG: flagellar basal body L-ring protein FlgH [Candidatus Cloacimonadota bacterium]|nr:flagellar basal body L-ring protein FlgH [Candidatus Cloacimonadota bacterium]
MIYKILIISLILFSSQVSFAAPFQSSTSLYTDEKAHRVGDIVTIYVVEQSTAQNKSGTNSDSKSDLGLGLGVEGFNDFTGVSFSGKYSNDSEKNKNFYSQEQLTTKISAQIVKIDSVGNFIIKGQKTVIVNGVEKATVLTGTIRPQDIESNNIIYSYNILNAKITHIGKGEKVKKSSFIDKIMNWIF